ncbi:MAG: MBL fold metallo-hydrolase [Anaerolineaceae bacterium]
MTNNVIQIPSSISRQYLVEGSSGYLLIDTGLSNNYTHLIKFLDKSKIPLNSIELVVITHADGDHFGCLSILQKDMPSMISAASTIEAEAIRQGESSRELHPSALAKVLISLLSPMFKANPARIDRILTFGEELPYLGGLEILDTNGHTPNHISLWSQSTRTLFSGDSIRINGNNLSPSIGANTWNPENA